MGGIDVEPKLVKRQCGGWLATSPDNERIKIGVTAHSMQGAVFQYKLALSRWRSLLASDEPRT